MELERCYGWILIAVCSFAMCDAHWDRGEPENPLIGPDDSLTFVGTNAVFTCASSFASCYNLTWHKVVSGLFTLYHIPINESAPGRTIVQNATAGCMVTIKNVSLQDAGYFVCKLTNESHSYVSRSAQLFVFTSKEEDALKGLSDNTTVAGFDASFTCISPLFDCRYMHWYKDTPGNDSVTIFSERDGVYLFGKYIVKLAALGCQLIIKRVEIGDAGTVYCQIEISQRQFERSASLFVLDALKGPDDALNFVGTNATFICASPLKSCVNITWQKYVDGWVSGGFQKISVLDRQFIVENYTTVGCKLTVRNVQLRNAEKLKCRLRVGDRYFEGRIAELSVINGTKEDALKGLSDVTTLVGHDAIFICISPLFNCDGMNWYKDTPGTDKVTIFSQKNAIYPSDKYTVENFRRGCRLTIHHADIGDAGTVYCEIDISQRKIERSATLFVLEALKGPDDALSFVDTNATFSCVSPLKSCVNITWLRYFDIALHTGFDPIPALDKKFIVENTTVGCKLTITNVQLAEAELYKCELKIEDRSFAGRDAELTVINGTEADALKGLSDYTTVIGYDASFICISPLFDCHDLNWYKDTPGTDRVTIFSQKNGIYLSDIYTVENYRRGCRLTIKRVDIGDAGTVYCQIEISQRKIERSASLFVLEAIKGPEDTLNLAGTNATFICVSPFKSCVNITWSKYHSDYFQSRFFPIYGSDKHLSVENTTAGCKLTLRNIRRRDTGRYKCALRVDGRSFDGSVAKLTVIDGTRTSALLGPSDRSSTVGLNATFTCVSPLRNCIGITWRKDLPGLDRVPVFSQHDGIYLRDKYIVENSTDGCQLTLKETDVMDSGLVHCELRISQRPIERSAFLLVYGDLEIDELP